jgi:hypothetical protein
MLCPFGDGNPWVTSVLHRIVGLMSNVPKVLIGAAIGVVNLVILLLIWRWWSRRTGPSVDTSKFTPRGVAAEQAAFKGDGAYSYGEFAGGSDSKAYGRHASEV